jgi:dTDP-4-dehydrorhamnose 3,5-epimerase
MEFLPTELAGVLIIEPDVHRDARGFFLESYHARRYREAGIPELFVQDNHSRSTRGTLRGLHAQRSRPHGKLVRVIEGEVFDVAVDVRRGSPTFGRWEGVILSAENFRQCYIPPGFLHGFCVLTEAAELEYKVTDFYSPADELGVIWNDPDLAIAWPVSDPILSQKDASLPLLAEIMDALPES